MTNMSSRILKIVIAAVVLAIFAILWINFPVVRIPTPFLRWAGGMIAGILAVVGLSALVSWLLDAKNRRQKAEFVPSDFAYADEVPSNVAVAGNVDGLVPAEPAEPDIVL